MDHARRTVAECIAFPALVLSLALPTARGSAQELWLNDGNGVFTDVSTTHLPPNNDDTQALALGDVDGDGDLDAYLGNDGAVFLSVGQNALWLNDGTGVFADATSTHLPVRDDNTLALDLGDVDGDGDLDALVGNYTGTVGGDPQNRLLLNDGAGHFTEVTSTRLPASDDDTAAVALRDLDGDGDRDCVLGSRVQDRVYLNRGDGVFADVTATSSYAMGTAEAIALRDVNGDSLPDALIASLGQNSLWLNDGTGQLVDVTATNLPGDTDWTTAIAVGDVDGDSDLDLYWANSGAPDRLHLNDGSGVFTDVTTTNLPAGRAGAAGGVALEDVDGDGDLDAFVGNFGQSELLLNDGTGVFVDATASHMPAVQLATRALAMGDLDGDGDVDAVLANQDCSYYCFSYPNRVYLNDGTGVFTDASATKPAGQDSSDIALGDLDGDGDLDAFLINLLGYEVRLNDGTGALAPAAASLPPAYYDGIGVALDDVNGDGHLDAVVANAANYLGWEEPNVLYLNDGRGVFVDRSSSLPAARDVDSGVATGDLDGDGDVDILFGAPTFPPGVPRSRVATNLRLQLTWRAVPAVGKPLALDVFGAPGRAWALLAAARAARIPLPPLGTLRLDPATAVLAGSGTLDAQGHTTVEFVVPSVPALVGVSVFWQALVSQMPALTNLELTTFSDL